MLNFLPLIPHVHQLQCISSMSSYSLLSIVSECFISLSSFHPLSAQQQRIDVVLVDTAGRMQNNEPLMRSLAKVDSP